VIGFSINDGASQPRASKMITFLSDDGA